MTKLTLLFKVLNREQLDNHLPWKNSVLSHAET